MTKVFYIDVSCFSNDKLFEAATAQLPAKRLEKIKKLKNSTDKYLCAGAWLALEEALKCFSAHSCDKEIALTKKGKPYFKNIKNIYFSLSHSGSIALCAVSDKEVGADVQLITDFCEKICKKYFSKDEEKYIFASSAQKDKTERFFRIWSLKEAYVKMTGEGLSGFKKLSLSEDANILEDAYFAEFNIDGYKASVCTNKKEKDFEFKKLNLSKILIK